MSTVEWILVVMLSVALFIFLVAGIVLAIKLIHLAEDAKKVIETSQSIAVKADDIVDNVKGMTSVGGIVKTFANHVMENQARKYAEQAHARDAEQASKEADRAEDAAYNAERTASAMEREADAMERGAEAVERGAEAAKKVEE